MSVNDMVGTGLNGGNTRRLPSWMLAPPADGAVDKSGLHADAKTGHKDGVSLKPHATRKAKILPKDKQGSSDAECGRKRGKRKASIQDAGCDGETREAVVDAKESKKGTDMIRESVTQGKTRRRTKKADIDVLEDAGLSEVTEAVDDEDDDFDLTVDDLMSIANEYISANGDPKEQKLSQRESAKEVLTTETRIMQVNPVDAFSSDPRHHLSSECLSGNPEENVSKEEVVAPIKTTGDPAQDMLNLLLGPLLKKHVDRKEKEKEYLSSSMSLTEEFSQNQTTNFVNEVVPQTKKKTSLKDKIAMFID